MLNTYPEGVPKMKKFILAALVTMSATSAFAQMCEVDMVDRYNRVIRTFRAYGDARTCMDGMRECRKEIAMGGVRNQGYDCIRRAVVAPNPRPNPRPNPNYGIEANGLILDAMNSVHTGEKKTKLAESFVANLNVYQFSSLVQLCSSTRTWPENASCITSSIQRAPIQYVDEISAQRAVGNACTSVTTTWPEENDCFRESQKFFPQLGYLTQTCLSMYNNESSARCFRQVFGN